jgi:hypothetical protein
MSARSVQFIAIVLTGLALIPVGAHLFTLPNKIALSQEDYFTVQGAYAGWAYLGLLPIAALMANGALAFLFWGKGKPFWFAVIAVLALAASLGVFFALVFPGNQATGNWTSVPENWRNLRTRWEYGHAVSALLVLAAFLSTTYSALTRKRRTDAAVTRDRSQTAVDHSIRDRTVFEARPWRAAGPSSEPPKDYARLG